MERAISAFLISALLVTGALTALVFAMPDLISLGYILLILPGLLLSIAPTVFLYLVAFSVPWFCFVSRGTHWAIVGGVTVVGWMSWGLPSLLNRQTDRWLLEAASKQVTPAASIAITPKTIGITRSPHVCDRLCLALLYNGSVERVVLPKRKLSLHIERRNTACPPAPFQNADEWEKTVRLRIAGGECLIATPGWTGPADLYFDEVREDIGQRPGFLSLAPGEVHAEGYQLRDGSTGKVLVRETSLSPRRFAIPLVLNPRGGSELRVWGFEFGREFPRKQQQRQRTEALRHPEAAFLERYTSLAAGPPAKDSVRPDDLRDLLDASLADPAANPSGLTLIPDFCEQLRHAKALRTGDLKRLAQIIADRRVTEPLDRLPFDILTPERIGSGSRPRHFDEQYHDAGPVIRGVTGEELAYLRNPLLARLEQLAASGDWKTFYKLASRWKWMPTVPEPRIDRLLAADPRARRNGPELIRCATVPPERLVEWVGEGYKQGPDNPDHYAEDAKAALRVLCGRGRDARNLLPALHGIERSLPDHAQQSDLWRATLVALGEDAAQYQLGPNRHWRLDLYHESLRKMARTGCRVR